MNQPVTLPFWLVLIGGLLALWAIFTSLLVPGVRGFFRRRANRVIDEVNKRLDLKIPSIALTKRQVMIDRLVYDPTVMEEVERQCTEAGIPRDVAVARVRLYAAEVAPAFNAYVYFRFGSWMSRKIVELLYRVRFGYVDEPALAQIDPQASVVFVMNHRSNIDYVLVAYLAVQRVALSYAVGEWARVWPLQQLIRALGAYFVRRGSGDALYRRVLERYVQMAIEGGAAQAIFLEGGLSRDGLMHDPKLGLLDYMLRRFDPRGNRDIVFVPVALNYDRVIEDRTLLALGDPDAERKSGFYAARVVFRTLFSHLWLRIRGKLFRLGYACANFGAPVSLRAYADDRDWTPCRDSREARISRVLELANYLTDRVGELVPVLPVSLVAEVLLRQGTELLSEAELRRQAGVLKDQLAAGGAMIHVPRDDPDYLVTVGLRMLLLRHIVEQQPGGYRVNPDELDILRYYANAIVHLRRAELRD